MLERYDLFFFESRPLFRNAPVCALLDNPRAGKTPEQRKARNQERRSLIEDYFYRGAAVASPDYRRDEETARRDVTQWKNEQLPFASAAILT